MRAFTSAERIEDVRCEVCSRLLQVTNRLLIPFSTLTCVAQTPVHAHAQKRQQLSSLPDVLVLQLKRFVVTPRGALKKITKFIRYTRHLNVAPFCHRDLIRSGAPLNYTLFAVVVHGGTLSGGHYVSYVLHEGEWFYVNDSRSRKASVQEAMSRSAYMLFYQREG